MHSVSAILSLALVLVAPGLCRGGLLVHPCDDDHAGSTTHERHNEKDGGCGHEEGCAQDPCSFAVRMTPSSRVSTALHGDGIDAVPLICLPKSIRMSPPDPVTFRCDGPPHFDLSSPQFERCLPLLI